MSGPTDDAVREDSTIERQAGLNMAADASETFVRDGRAALSLIERYWTRLIAGDPTLPVKPVMQPGDLMSRLPISAPEAGEPIEVALRDIEREIVPALTHWQHPHFYAYFPANGSPPAVVGELLSAGLGVNGMLWATSPAATELEQRVLDWMQEALGLPATFRNNSQRGGGCIQGTASEATLVALIAARSRARRAGHRGPLTAYCSAQAHSSVLKAGLIAGLADGPDGVGHDGSAVRMVPVRDADMAMDVKALGTMMAEDRAAGKRPIFVCATLGSTGTMAFDDLRAIGACTDESVWMHVDAAMAGAAWVCPEFRTPLEGIERADSLCFNPHKWLLTSFDCDLMWTRDCAALTGALSVTPEYLKTTTTGMVTDYRDWQIPLGRRFRALKLWMVLRHYGLAQLRTYIRHHVQAAAEAEGTLRGDRRFEVPTPREKSSPLVVFRLAGPERTIGEAKMLNAQNAEFMARLNASGRLLLSHTVIPAAGAHRDDPQWPGRYVLRLAIGGTFTTSEHVREAVAMIRAEAGR
ncbi:MAG: pyridoxal-dependent decarboxylase [Phycisphaerales bacterium]|jgi:aromatic-L-amino-acid decarboxylase|nr:pyridoxal-dependent decarboxylase [Phycisphaerales bacterium]